MGKKVKFPLIMADEAQVRTLEELREHFDLATVLGYYDSGKLKEWLTDRYYEDEANVINSLDSTAGEFKKCLCDILGVPYPDGGTENVNMEEISTRNERRERLKMFTADDKILAAVDHVAFSQENLADLLDENVKVIYLCGEQFKIPGSKGGVTYIGVNNPKVDVPAGYNDKGIVFQNVDLGEADAIHSAKDIDSILRQVEEAITAEDYDEAFKLLSKVAKQGDAAAQYRFAEFFWANSFHIHVSNDLVDLEDVEDYYLEATKWYLKAAEQGHVKAQIEMGDRYSKGRGIEKNTVEALKWYRKAAEQGDASAIKLLEEELGNLVTDAYLDADVKFSMIVEEVAEVGTWVNVAGKISLGTISSGEELLVVSGNSGTMRRASVIGINNMIGDGHAKAGVAVEISLEGVQYSNIEQGDKLIKL